MSKFTTSRPKKGRRIERNGRCRTNLDHFLVEAGDGFVRDALCADLPNLQKRCADIRLWTGFSKFSMVDSHVSRQIPNIRLKNRRTFAPFTTVVRRLINDVKVRRNQPEGSNVAFKVRSIQKPHGWSRFWSRGFDGRDENLCHLSSPEKCPVVMKRSQILEIVSNLHLQKIALKVRRDGPQPSIFVRSFSQITTSFRWSKTHILTLPIKPLIYDAWEI